MNFEPMTLRDLAPEAARLQPADPIWDQPVLPLRPRPPLEVFAEGLIELRDSVVGAIVEGVRWLNGRVAALAPPVEPERPAHLGIADRRLRSLMLRVDRRAARRARRAR